MSLQSKFISLGALLGLIVVALITQGFLATKARNAALNEQTTYANVIQRHMEADMMHDAMHSDVLIGVLGQINQTPDAVTQAREALKEHHKNFEDNLKANQAVISDPALRAKIDAMKPALDAYFAAGNEVLDAISANQDASAARQNFEASFEVMEKENGAVSDAIVTHAELVAKNFKAGEAKSNLFTEGFYALTLAGLFAMVFLSWRTILRPLARLTGQIDAMAHGDTTLNIDGTKRRDEIGILARATESLRTQVVEAFRVEQMVQAMPTSVMAVDVRNNLKINYVNKASKKLLTRLQAHLSVKADDIIGQSMDIFHKAPEHQRRLLADPKNLPYRAKIKFGEEDIDLQISPVFDAKGDYVAAMLVWEVVTQKAQLTHDFQSNVQDVASNVAAASVELSQVAATITKELEASAELAISATTVATETAANVQTVAAAAEELSASVREISGQIQKTNEIVQSSHSKVQNADLLAQKLSSASERVYEVTDVIASISGQINLLALNATIESARAGDAGRGFAVVAGEVKNLANQTNRSISEINGVIEEMRHASNEIIGALKEIKQSVADITEATTSVASAVEEQSATTQDIARNMAHAAQGTYQISENLTSVSALTAKTGASSEQLYGASQDLSVQATHLQDRVDTFLDKISSVSAA